MLLNWMKRMRRKLLIRGNWRKIMLVRGRMAKVGAKCADALFEGLGLLPYCIGRGKEGGQRCKRKSRRLKIR